MPPKVAKTAEDGDPNFKFVFSVLKYCESVKPSWENVAKEIGIGYGKNAQSKFKNLVEKHGFKFEAGRILTPDEDGSTATATATATDSPAAKTVTKTPKTPRTPKTPKTAGSKRKAAEANGDDVDGTPTKPAKKKKAPKSEVVVKDEIKDEEINGEVKDEEMNGEVKEDVEADTTKGEIKDDEDDLDAEIDLTPQQVADMIP